MLITDMYGAGSADYRPMQINIDPQSVEAVAASALRNIVANATKPLLHTASGFSVGVATFHLPVGPTATVVTEDADSPERFIEVNRLGDALLLVDVLAGDVFGGEYVRTRRAIVRRASDAVPALEVTVDVSVARDQYSALLRTFTRRFFDSVPDIDSDLILLRVQRRAHSERE